MVGELCADKGRGEIIAHRTVKIPNKLYTARTGPSAPAAQLKSSLITFLRLYYIPYKSMQQGTAVYSRYPSMYFQPREVSINAVTLLKGSTKARRQCRPESRSTPSTCIHRQHHKQTKTTWYIPDSLLSQPYQPPHDTHDCMKFVL